MIKKSILVTASIVGYIGAATFPGAAQSLLSPDDQRIMHQQAQHLDPQTEDHLHRPQPEPKHKGQDKTGTKTASDVAVIQEAALAALDPSQVGQWAYEQPFPTDFNAIHVVCSPTGKCLLVAGSGKSATTFQAKTFRSYVYNTVTKTKKLIYTPDDLFCNGHVLLPDGRALLTGGTASYNPYKGTRTQYVFNFATEAYQKLTNLSVGRWYPSVVTMADGKQLIASGLNDTGAKTNLVETFDYRTNTTTKLAGTRTLPLYPHLYQTSKPNEIFHAGPNGTGFWNPYTGAFRAVAKQVGTMPNGFTSCFHGDVREQNLITMGGGWPATAKTNIIDLDAATPAYRAGPPLSAAKAYVSCITLPDGTLFEAHGGYDNTVAASSRTTGLLATLAGPWQAMSPLPEGEHRVYHQILWLLDDGRVVSMSSNPKGSPRSTSHLVYSPPYLAKGQRPVITSHPTEVKYGAAYAVGTTAAAGQTVNRITITAAPSQTHSIDLNQRYLSLPLVNGSITLPAQPTVMPPGWYRIWAVDTNNIPSVAKWIHIQ